MEKHQSRKLNFIGLLIIGLAISMTGLMSWLLFQRTVDLLTSNLQQRLLSIATTAASEIEANDINELQTEADYKKPAWSKVVTQMKKMRLNNKDIIFMYIFRKSKDDVSKMVFVADSHSLNPYANVDSNINSRVDVNGDGVINDTDVLQWPGQGYDPPIEGYDAYNGPTTNKKLYSDSFGTYISGYAPIKDNQGNTVAVLAADVQADDFYTITTQTFIPFLAFILGLVAVILALAYGLIRIWKNQLELIDEIDRQKDDLLSMVSHQLAAPVTAMKWYLELLLDGDIGAISTEQKNQLNMMQTITVNLSDLVSMILDVSRIQLGRMRVEPQVVDVKEFLSEIFSVIDPKAKQGSIHFVKNIPDDIPKFTFDKRLTRMTIENILTNAIKYTPKNGSVTMTLQAENGDLRIVISDTGCGIPKNEQDKIFSPLFRASNVRDTIEGNGFGMYVAKGAIENQGGTISFTSELGKGTTFSIALPGKEAIG